MANHHEVLRIAGRRTALVYVALSTLLVTAGAALPNLLLAQPLSKVPVAVPQAGPQTLVGIVVDTLGAPIGGADVAVTSLGRYTRTRENGTFRFDSIKAGEYQVSARRIGYVGGTHQVTVGANGGSLTLTMIQVGYGLPSVVSVATRGGLSGVIADTGYRPMADVSIRVIGAGKTVQTDSAGAFFLPLTPGEYLVRIERDGFSRQTIGLTIPENEGRRIAAFMVPRKGPANHMESQALFDLHQRMIRSSPASSHYYSNEALRNSGIRDMWDLARRWALGRFASDCLVTVGGTNFRLPIATVTTADVEFAEVYQQSNRFGSGARGVTSLAGNSTRFMTSTSVQPATTASCGNVAIVVWLRQ